MFETQNNQLPPGISEKHPHLLFITIGVILIVIIIWGVVELNKTAEQVAEVDTETAPVLSEEEMIRQRLAELATQNAAEQVPVSQDEVEARLAELREQATADTVEVSEEEVQARLKELSAENAKPQ